MRRLLGGLVAVVSLVAFATPTAVAADRSSGHPGGEPQVVPVHRIAGSTAGRLVGDFWYENLRLPAGASPAEGTANLCYDLGRGHRVLVPSGGITDANGRIEMSCTVRVGRPVVMELASAECSSVEQPPFQLTAENRGTCAADLIRPGVVTTPDDVDVPTVTLEVDDGPVVDLRQPCFFAVSRPRPVVLPIGSVDGASGPATFEAAGWLAQIRGMSVGDHTATGLNVFVVDGGDPVTITFVVHFHVVR